MIFVLVLNSKSGYCSIGRHSPVRCSICRTVFCTIELVRLEGLLRLRFSCPDRRRRRLDHRHGYDLVHILPSLRGRVSVRPIPVDGLVLITHALVPQVALARLPYRRWKRILVACLRTVLLGVTPFARLVLQCYSVFRISLPLGHPRFLGDRSVACTCVALSLTHW